MSKWTPASISEQLLDYLGWEVLDKETKRDRWGRTQDVMGFADYLVSVRPLGYLLALQVTDCTNYASRVRKVRGAEKAEGWLRGGGRIEVWGICEPSKRFGWRVKRKRIGTEDLN